MANTQNTPSSEELSRKVYAKILAAFNQSLTEHGYDGFESQADLLNKSIYIRGDVMKFLAVHVSEKIAGEILDRFEASKDGNTYMNHLKDYLTSQSSVITSVIETLASTRDMVSSLTLPSPRQVIITSGAVATVAACGVAIDQSSNHAPEVNPGKLTEQLLTAQQVEDMKKITINFGDVNTMMVLNKSGGFSFEELAPVQTSMGACSIDLEKLTTTATELPESCNTAMENLSSMLEGHTKDTLAGLKQLQQSEPNSNTDLTITMIEQFQQASQTSIDTLNNTPKENKTAKYAAMLAALLALGSLFLWVSRGRNRLTDHPSDEARREGLRGIDKLDKTILESIRNKISKRNTSVPDSSVPKAMFAPGANTGVGDTDGIPLGNDPKDY